MDSFTATAMSSGLPSSLGRDRGADRDSNALKALAECRRQREQQEQLLLKAQEELQKAAQLAKTATERRVGAPPALGCERADAVPAVPALTPTSLHLASKASVPHVRPALRGALRRQKSDGEALKSEAAKSNGVSASLRAAAALSPHRGFYHGSSPRRPRAQTSSGRLAWADAPACAVPPAQPEVMETPETPAEMAEVDGGEDEKTPETLEAEVVADPELKTSPSWKRLEKTITQYVSRRTVTSSEYEQVRQRYEGHLHELKTLCETVGRSERTVKPSPSGPSPAGQSPGPSCRRAGGERSRGALNFRELQDEKDFRDFLELRDPLFSSRAGKAPKSKATSPRIRSGRKSSETGPVSPAEENESSVVPPLLSARMLSAVPMALLHQDNDLEHVRSLFCAQVPEAQVLNIYRVENPTLAGVYSAVRDAMGSDSELDLWHGTSSECVPNIVLNGFNRAYSGRSHGTKLGHGSYFSASAAYSTRFCDRKRHRRTVFFAKVLVGAWAKGSPELVEPPCKDSEGLLRYDCTVDDPESPVNFCIFRDFQAMPTYLLEFIQPKENVRS